MLLKRIALVLLMALAPLFVGGCSAIKGLAEFTQENQIVVDVAVRQAVYRYIDAGDTEADKDARAGSVGKVVRKVDSYLEGDPTAGPGTLLKVVDSSIRWDKISNADAALLRDVMTLVRHNLQNRQSEGLLDTDAVIALKGVLKIALLTATSL